MSDTLASTSSWVNVRPVVLGICVMCICPCQLLVAGLLVGGERKGLNVGGGEFDGAN